MPPDGHTVPMKYLDTGTVAINTSGGVTTEMCPLCFTFAPTELIQAHIDSHPQRPGPPEPPPPEVNPL